MLSISHWGLFEHVALENKERVLYCHFRDGKWSWAFD
ncbi:hypothetical protein ACVWW4_004007 [Bradyrhizobium sp. LB7.1]